MIYYIYMKNNIKITKSFKEYLYQNNLGFSVIELAMVLIIISLIIGVIMGGVKLVESAKIIKG